MERKGSVKQGDVKAPPGTQMGTSGKTGSFSTPKNQAGERPLPLS